VTTAADVQLMGLAITATVSGNAITSESLARLMYTAADSGGNIHMYGLDLTSATTPTPVQIGNLSLTADTQICDEGFAETNLYSPSTMFVLLHVSTSSTCGTGGDVYEVINYTDSTSTAPTVVSVTSTAIDGMYHSTGALAGMILLEGTNLHFYATKAFTSPTTLVPNVTDSVDLVDTTTLGQDLIGDSVAFYSVTNATNTQLYRITTAGTATSVYTAVGLGLDAGDRVDAANIFFTDSDSMHDRILRAPINSGSAVLLYTADATLGNYSLIGSNGSVLAFEEDSNAGNGTVQTISATAATTTPTTIATFTGLQITSAFLAEATPGTLSSAQVVVNATNVATGAKSSEVLTPSGTVKQALLANSEFEYFSIGLSDILFQVRGITDTGPGSGDGGGSVNTYNVSSSVVTPLTLSGGGAYTIPTANLAIIGAIASTAAEVIGVGVLNSTSGSTTGLAADSTGHLIVPITFTNTAITPF
jgi:hypothetical protein